MAKICIVGYGYVGRSQGVLLRSSGHMVTAVDPKAATGRSREVMMDNVRVYSPEHADNPIADCDFAIVCVPTPAREDGSCDTSIVEAAVAHVIATNRRDCLILIRSTVPPGTTERLGRELTLVDGRLTNADMRVHFSPEFVVERTGDEIRDRMIVGGPRADEIHRIFERVLPAEARRVTVTPTEAEMVKYMTNAFLAVKVAFATEMSDIAGKLGISYPLLREVWLMDERVGRSHTMVYGDRRGFGGKCLPKDTLALHELAAGRGVAAPVLGAALMYSQGPDQPNGT